MKTRGWPLACALLAPACTTHLELGERVLDPPVTVVETTWLGNSGGRSRQQWMQRTVSHVHALPDDRVTA